MSNKIYGSHEKCPLDVMPEGTVLYLAEVGDSFDPHPGIDLSDEPRDVMIRIQWLFGEHGACYPPEEKRPGFLQRIASLVANTPDCHVWVGGNEPNVGTEGCFSPKETAENYSSIRAVVHAQKGHEDDCVLLPPIGPWNVESGMGWIEYFKKLISLCPNIDGFALHTYSRGDAPASIIDQAKMGPPYEMYYNGFQTYRDWMAAIPDILRALPVYITETDQNDAWTDLPNTWVQEAYAEINRRNQENDQQIRSLILYRWPNHDKYYIEGKTHVIDDFKLAQTHDYVWKETPVAEEWTIKYENHCNDYYDQDGSPEVTVPIGYYVEWIGVRPEMDRKYEPQSEVFPEDPPYSGVGFHVYQTFDWTLTTSQPIAVAAGKRTKLEVALMVISHGVDDNPDKLGDCGFQIGIGEPGGVQYWSEWWTLRDGPGGNLIEGKWISPETPEFVPTVGQVEVYIRCVANIAASISAGHYDRIRVWQVDGSSPPPTGEYTVVVYDPAGAEVSRCSFPAASTDPQVCVLAQKIVALSCGG